MQELDLQISRSSPADEPLLDKLRLKRKQKVKAIADTNGQLSVRRPCHLLGSINDLCMIASYTRLLIVSRNVQLINYCRNM